jgi:hypothetical protein
MNRAGRECARNESVSGEPVVAPPPPSWLSPIGGRSRLSPTGLAHNRRQLRRRGDVSRAGSPPPSGGHCLAKQRGPSKAGPLFGARVQHVPVARASCRARSPAAIVRTARRALNRQTAPTNRPTMHKSKKRLLPPPPLLPGDFGEHTRLQSDNRIVLARARPPMLRNQSRPRCLRSPPPMNLNRERSATLSQPGRSTLSGVVARRPLALAIERTS